MSEKPKFTPGPWVLDADEDGEFHIRMGTAIEDPGQFECQHEIRWDPDLYPEDGEQYEEAFANAVLATAAPDMYAALHEIRNLAPQIECNCAPTYGIVCQAHHIMSIADAALAKAQGTPERTGEQK